jgi:hypothetical protein
MPRRYVLRRGFSLDRHSDPTEFKHESECASLEAKLRKNQGMA